MSKSIGSRTAKGSFNEEDFLVKKLNNDAKKIKGNYKSDI